MFTHPAVMGFDFIVIVPLLPSHCGFSFVFGCGVSFFGEFQCLPVDDCSAVSCDSGALTRGSGRMSFYSAILNQTPLVIFHWSFNLPFLFFFFFLKFYLFIYLFIYLFLAVLGLRCCAGFL